MTLGLPAECREKIEEEIRRRGFNKQTFAIKVLGESSDSKFKKTMLGKREPSLSEMIQICAALGFTLEELWITEEDRLQILEAKAHRLSKEKSEEELDALPKAGDSSNQVA